MVDIESTEEKKAYVLIHAIIFHYHGLDEEEERRLEQLAAKIEAKEELTWAYNFISKDYLTAFERAGNLLSKVMLGMDKSKRIKFLNDTWMANFQKGYITEMEATAMLQLAADWDISKDFVGLVEKA